MPNTRNAAVSDNNRRPSRTRLPPSGVSPGAHRAGACTENSVRPSHPDEQGAPHPRVSARDLCVAGPASGPGLQSRKTESRRGLEPRVGSGSDPGVSPWNRGSCGRFHPGELRHHHANFRIRSDRKHPWSGTHEPSFDGVPHHLNQGLFPWSSHTPVAAAMPENQSTEHSTPRDYHRLPRDAGTSVTEIRSNRISKTQRARRPRADLDSDPDPDPGYRRHQRHSSIGHEIRNEGSYPISLQKRWNNKTRQTPTRHHPGEAPASVSTPIFHRP